MIIEFSVTNFGSIREKQTLSFEATKDTTLADYYIVEPIPKLRLLKLAMIFGPNASGKSTVLKALEFLREQILKPAHNKADKLPFQPFLLDDFSKNESSSFELLFIQEGVRYRYNIKFNQKCVLFESLDFTPHGREANFFTRKTNIESQTVEIEYGSLVEIDNKNRYKLETAILWNNAALGVFSKANIDFKDLKKVYSWFEDYLMSMISSEMNLFDLTMEKIRSSSKIKSEVVQLLKYADVQIENIDIIEKEIEFDKQQVKLLTELPNLPEYLRNKIEASDGKMKVINLAFRHLGKDNNGNNTLIPLKSEQESNGTLRYFCLGGVIATLFTEQKAVSIDEFESSLHPDLALNYILRFLVQSKKSQLLITTHNIDFLGEQDVIRRDGVWFTQKNENGATELYSAADFDTSVIRKSSSLLNIYEAGRLGAKPNLGSIFS
jgi:AAA15 family ATPase/GTPase